MTKAAPSLTPKQRAFVEAYLKHENAAQAYRDAYNTKASPAAAGREGARLLQHPLIAPKVAEARKRAEAATQRVLTRYEVTKENISRELARIGFADMRRLMKWGADGVTLIDSAELTDDEAAAVSEVSQTITEAGGSIKLKVHDKRVALMDLARLQGFLVDKHEHTGANGGPIETKDVSTSDLARWIAAKLTSATEPA